MSTNLTSSATKPLSDEEFDKLPDAESIATKPLSDEEFDKLPDAEIPEVQQPEVKGDAEVSAITAPASGYVAGRAVQSGIENLGKAIVEAPEKIAMKIGGLTPEQVADYKLNYRTMESGKGITQESIDEAYSKLENAFKQKNVQANIARETAEQALDVPVTEKLSKQAMEAALPKVLDKIPVESQAFKETLQKQVASKVESEINRLSNLLEQKKQMLISSSEIAQTKAEEAGREAVKAAVPKKTAGTLELEPVDTKKTYNEAFDKAIAQYSPEESKSKASISKDIIDIQNELEDLKNEYYQDTNIAPKAREDLIKSRTTELAKDYPSAYGYQDPSKAFPSQVETIEKKLSDVSSLEKKDAADYLRKSRALGWEKGEKGVAEVSSELSKAYTDELRSLMAPAGSKADIEYKRVSSLLNQLKEAQQNKFITRNIGDVVDDEIIGKFDPESVSIDLKNREVINKVMNPSKADLKDPAIKEARIALDRLIEDPDLVDEIKRAAIKANLIDEKKAFKFGPYDALRLTLATGASSFLPVGVYEGMKYAKTPQGAYKLATLAPRIGDVVSDIASKYPKTSKIAGGLAKFGLKAIPTASAGLAGIAAQAAEEGLDSTTSGALPTTISEDVQGQQFSPFWEERGFTPSEALEKAKIKSFEEEYGTQPKTIQQQYPSNLALEGMMDIAESPEITSQRESLQKQKQLLEESKKLREERRLETLKVKQLGALAPTYVEAPLKQVLKADSPAEISSIAQSMQTMPDKASQEYSRVLSQIVDAPVSQKEAVLFGLNQQPAFRELVRKLKDQQKTEDETPLMLKGPA